MSLRIAMISEHASPLADLGGPDAGGQNVHVAQLARSLAQRGHEVRVYTRRDSEHLPPSVESPDGYVVEHVPAGPAASVPKDNLLRHMDKFGDWLAKRWRTGPFAPDVVHAHFWMSGVAALAARRMAEFPLVVTYHALGTVKRRMQGEEDTSPAERIAWERQVGLAAQCVVAQSTDEVQELCGYHIPSGRLAVVTSGVDTALFTPGPAPRHSRPTILSVGRLVRRKGFADLIRALPQLPEAELVIVGGPPHAQLDSEPVALWLRALARELGVLERVHLLGAVRQEEMPSHYRSADVVACVPAYEPFGITPLEAMACGTPVVAYAVGGLRDSVRHNETGLLVPPGDIPRLTEALRHMLTDRDTRRSHARASVRWVRERYQWRWIAARMEMVYQHVLAAREPTAPVAAARAA